MELFDHPMTAAAREQIQIHFDNAGKPWACVATAAINFLAMYGFSQGMADKIGAFATACTAVIGVGVSLMVFASGAAKAAEQWLNVVRKWRELPPSNHVSRLKRITRLFQRK